MLSASASPANSIVTTIAPSKGWVRLDLRELWAHRELLYFFVWRDIKVRYKQTALGAAWAVLQPVFTMLVFTLFFGRLAKMPSDGVPYPVFTFAALVPWLFFANGLTFASGSLVANGNMIKKIYFPRLVVPAATIFAGFVDFLLALVVLFTLMAWNGVFPTATVLFILPLMLIAIMASLGAGLWFAALNVRYRDVRYVVPFVVQFWFFSTPIIYPSSMLSEPWRTLYGLNPMAGVIEGVRWSLFHSKAFTPGIVGVSAAAALVLFVSGLIYFKNSERTFADEV